METVTIQLLDNSMSGDKVYQYKDIELINLQRDSQRLRQYNDYALYILLGPMIKNREIYVGQSTDVSRRLYEHRLQKSFWTECIFIINKTNPFTKTDIAWLEEYMIKEFLDLNYFQDMHNYQIPQNVRISSISAPYLNETVEQMKVLIDIFGGLRIDLNDEKRNFKGTMPKSGKKMIDRIAQSYIDNCYSDSLYYCFEPADDYGIVSNDMFKYLEMDNGKVIIFNGSQLNGTIPKKYKDKVVGNILQEDIVVDNVIKANEIINFKHNGKKY